MYNKLLADLVRDRLNDELEKIKLELFEDDYYAEDIEDSVQMVKRQLANEAGSAAAQPEQEAVNEDAPTELVPEQPRQADMPSPVLEEQNDEPKTDGKPIPSVSDEPIQAPAVEEAKPVEIPAPKEEPAKLMDLSKVAEEIDLDPHGPAPQELKQLEEKVQYMNERPARYDPLKISAAVLFTTLVGLTGYLIVAN